MTKPIRIRRWALRWRSRNYLDGTTEYLVCRPTCCRVISFETRREAREFRAQTFGYINSRPDLRGEPHGWLVPKIVRVEITTREV